MSARILVVVSGSIAAYKACEVVSRLVQAGHEVRVVLTEGGARFVGEPTWEGLCGCRVQRDLFASGEALAHIELSRWASVILVCPASANLLNRAAVGLADDLAGALLLARDRTRPLVLAPAMNPAMWEHPATRQAVERLREWGGRFVPVGAGRTACGETGEGRMAEPADIVAAVTAALESPRRGLRVLVTSGGTSEPIDDIRVLTNLSSGHTGAVIARHFEQQGHAVTLLRAERAEPPGVADELTFVTFDDLAGLLERRLAASDFDAVIHAAAVSDFRVAAAGGKLPSEIAHTLVLQPQRKLVNGIRTASRNPGMRLVAFKLAATADGEKAGLNETPPAVTRLLVESGADFVVYNVIGERTAPDAFPSRLYGADGGRVGECSTRGELAGRLETLLVGLAPPAGPERVGTTRAT